MLSLKQTTYLLQSGRLEGKQLELIKRLHKENLVKCGKAKSKNLTNNIVESEVKGDIRFSPAKGQKYDTIRQGIEKSYRNQNKLSFYNINPETGEREFLTKDQLSCYSLMIAKGYSKKQSLKEAKKLCWN
jgi:hypothetical protein